MDIIYCIDKVPSADKISELFKKAELSRPTDNLARIKKMIEHADLIVTAWSGEELVGVVRIITDWVWCSYLSDLAVDPSCKKSGIGRELLRLAREKLGPETMIVLLAVPSAMDYYPKVGFQKDDRAFSIPR